MFACAIRTPESRPADSFSLAAMVSSDPPFGRTFDTLRKRNARLDDEITGHESGRRPRSG